MLAELLLTVVIAGGLAFVIFIVFFNTQTVAVVERKKSKKKSKKPKGKASPKKQPKYKIPLIKTMNAAKAKPKIRLNDHEHLVSVFRGHTGDITGVAWHQSGKYLVSSSKDKYIYIWENPTQSQITLSFIGAVQTKDNGYFSALNTIVKPNTDDNKTTPYPYEDEEEKNKNELSKYDDIANAVFASTNGSYGLNSYNLKYAPTSHKVRCQITSNVQTEFVKEDIQCICVSSSLTFIAVSGSHNTKIYFYDIKKKRRESKRQRIVINIAPTNKNKATMKKMVQNADKSVGVIDGGQFINYEMNVSMDGDWLSIGTFKKDIRLWRINYTKPGKRDVIQERRFGGTTLLCSMINAHNKSITCVTFSCDSKCMISASMDGCIKVWDIVNCDYPRGHKPEMVLESDLGIGGIQNVIMSYQYDIVAVLNETRRCIYIYKIKYEKKKIKLHCTFDHVLCNEKNKDSKINCIRFSPDSQYIAVGTSDFDVRVYKIPAHKKSSK